MREDIFVHEPFLNELENIGWNNTQNGCEVIRLGRFHQKPEQSYRESFSDVVMKEKLRESLLKINDFLEEDQIEECVTRLTSYTSRGLIENNSKIFELLLQGMSVSENRKTKAKSPTVKFIDFDTIDNNSFIAVSELGVKAKGNDDIFYPDITLFINGIPLVVVEAKSPKVKNALGEAFSDLQDYAQIKSTKKRGNSELFFYNLFMVVTDTNKCQFGTITTNSLKGFWRWADPYPKCLDDLPRSGAGTPNDQNRLIYGMLDKKNLLEIFQSFSVFSSEEEGVSKVICRYQQFRAVKKAIIRLQEGENAEEKGGLIWHTQGSGKSLTMMFLIRAMYATKKFDDWKIILVNDRTDLETQLTSTATKIGVKVKVADSIAALKEQIKSPATDIVMAMVHKFQERDIYNSVFPTLNKSEKILIMVDEAHRSIYKSLGSNITKAAPNAVLIGYTGTPVDKSEKLFKDYIDKYTMKDSIEDGATLRIVYEGRAHKTDIKDGMIVDIFEGLEIDEESGELKGLNAEIKKAYLESDKTIETKARDMIEHYLTHVYPNGYKAQIVANSQRAAVKYKKIIDKILEEKQEKFKVDIVISGVNDDEEIRAYAKQDNDAITTSFKLRFNQQKDDLKGDIGILIVNNMLLTGFDAKIEQVMYLDRVLKAHNLLQAIARVNRVYDEGKNVGFVVDYIGVGNHLKDALDFYDAKEASNDLGEGLWDIDRLVAELQDVSKRLNEFIEEQGVTIDDLESWFELFYDEETRFRFLELFKEFEKNLDALYPAAVALDFVQDFKAYSTLHVQAMEYEEDESKKINSKKLQSIVDQYLISKGIEIKVKPIEIFSDEFVKKTNARKSLKAKAAEIEKALTKYLTVNMLLDPSLYGSFLEMLKKILEQFKENWEEIYKQLEELRAKLKKKEEELSYGLSREQKPYLNLFAKELFGKIEDLNEDQIEVVVRLTKDVYEVVERETSAKYFWDSKPAKLRLQSEIQQVLLSEEFSKVEAIVKKYKSLILKIVEIAESPKSMKENEVLKQHDSQENFERKIIDIVNQSIREYNVIKIQRPSKHNEVSSYQENLVTKFIVIGDLSDNNVTAKIVNIRNTFEAANAIKNSVIALLSGANTVYAASNDASTMLDIFNSNIADVISKLPAFASAAIGLGVLGYSIHNTMKIEIDDLHTIATLAALKESYVSSPDRVVFSKEELLERTNTLLQENNRGTMRQKDLEGVIEKMMTQYKCLEEYNGKYYLLDEVEVKSNNF